MSDDRVTPDHIWHLAIGFWPAKVILSAVDLDLFTTLAAGPMTCDAISERIGLHHRSAKDYLDTLAALKLLERDGDKYSNAADVDFFLDRNKPAYIGAFLELIDNRLYPMWETFTDALQTGEPQNEGKGGKDFFESLYADPERTAKFASAMTGISIGVAHALAEKFPWNDVESFVDIGCAQGGVPVHLSLKHNHLTGGGLDLPPIKPVFDNYVKQHGLERRLQFYSADFFREELPGADVLIMGHILHNWNLEEKKTLLDKAYRALPEGGHLIVYEWLLDDDRRANVPGLLMSLHMLMETQGGFNFTASEGRQWMQEAGFKNVRVEPLLGPNSMMIGNK